MTTEAERQARDCKLCGQPSEDCECCPDCGLYEDCDCGDDDE